MASSYKLAYFDGRGLAEISRLLFTLAGVPFEDIRFSAEGEKKEWNQAKPDYPFEKIPQLTVDGHKIPQSKAIERFLARRFGFFGSNELETARVDAFSEQVRDINISYNQARGNDEKIAKFWAEDFPANIAILAKNAPNDGHFVGGKFSLPDVQFYYITSTFFTTQDKVDAVLSKYDNLLKIREAVANNDRIREYVKNRKATPW
eukprot:TRINITY_DN1907_c0_g1_i1.p1 TRINITY_DN1907_c0_g1~~TRINITY_DN1907_c0_g1_i1.p1  ORF type:complete len:204 (+),score=39.16 TRINITY_DN1907_c0_g1_i1:96-707(+)